MSTNFRQLGENITMAAPSGGILSGAGFLYGNLFGVAHYSALEGAPVEVGTEGVWVLPKPDSVISFAVGAPCYWDVSEANVTSVAASNFLIGVATAQAGATDATVSVRLNGIATFAEAGG